MQSHTLMTACRRSAGPMCEQRLTGRKDSRGVSGHLWPLICLMCWPKGSA